MSSSYMELHQALISYIKTINDVCREAFKEAPESPFVFDVKCSNV